MNGRDKRQERRWRRRAAAPKPPCPNCGQPGPHFVPPSLGEPGFYSCVLKPLRAQVAALAFLYDITEERALELLQTAYCTPLPRAGILASPPDQENPTS